HRRDQRRSQTLRVDRTSKPHPRRCQTWEANVRVIPLADHAGIGSCYKWRILLGAIVAVLAWFITNWVGKPIIDVRDKRLKALQAAEQHAFVGFVAGNEREAGARAALNEAASGLQSISRGHGWPVRLYCRLARYDLEAAANWLITMHNMAGKI